MEMVDSVGEITSSRSIEGKYFSNFELLDARIASALNKMIQNSHFKKEGQSRGTGSPERGWVSSKKKQIAYMIYYYFRVTGAHESVLGYADLFSITLRSDDVQEFDTRWDEILWSMTKIPCDDVLESLYKLRIRESDQLKTVLKLYDIKRYRCPSIRS